MSLYKYQNWKKNKLESHEQIFKPISKSPVSKVILPMKLKKQERPSHSSLEDEDEECNGLLINEVKSMKSSSHSEDN
jgi:hypothetical protein